MKKLSNLKETLRAKNLRKFKQFEGWGIGKVDYKSIVFVISTVFMPYSLNASKLINLLSKFPIK